MRTNFEEKSYENYFNNELDRQSEIYFPLGQVQEGYFGFDSSAFSINRRLWRRLGHPFWFFPPFGGAELQDIADEMEHWLNIEIDHVPKMKANILFQYKKPEHIVSSLGKEWHLWAQPYFRYDIYPEQQDLLMHIDSRFGGKILIIYAAPAVRDINELVSIHMKRQIIDYSNFKRAADLNGHNRNTYIHAGTYSIACSEPEKIDNLNLLKEFEAISKIKIEEGKSNKEYIINFRKQIVSLVNDVPFYSSSFNQLNERISKWNRFELLYTFMVMSHFKQLTGVQWLIKV